MTYTYEVRTAFSAVMRSWRERRSCLPARPGTVVLCAILRAAFLNILRSCCSRGCAASRRGYDEECSQAVEQSNTSDTGRSKWEGGGAQYCAGLSNSEGMVPRQTAHTEERLRKSPDTAPRRSIPADEIILSRRATKRSSSCSASCHSGRLRNCARHVHPQYSSFEQKIGGHTIRWSKMRRVTAPT